MEHLNVEIKAKCQNQNSIREILKLNKADFKGIDRQIDTYFKVNSGRLKLREGNIENSLIFYERENKEGPKQSNVILFKTTKDSSLKEILTKLFEILAIVDKNREPERRTYPSGGARFPVELYLFSFNIEGLDKGAYHYNIKEEKIELLLKKDLTNKRRELISPYLENPAAVISFTSVISRSEVKYGYRAYPYSLIESGHMGQNIHLKCAELGIGSCSVSGFVDKIIAELLDLTEDEIPIYTIGLGKKKRI